MSSSNKECKWHEQDGADFTVTLNSATTPWPTTKGTFNVVCTSCEEHFIVKGEQYDLSVL